MSKTLFCMSPKYLSNRHIIHFSKGLRYIFLYKNVEKLKELGLDVPQVTLLTHNLRDMGYEIPEDIIDLDECVDELLKILRTDKND